MAQTGLDGRWRHAYRRVVGVSRGAAIERRDLRTGATVWEAYPTRTAESRRLVRSRKADVLIVGAGITGALVAEAATAVGLSTVILDRRLPAEGSTAASTALLQFEIDTPLLHLADHIGFELASRAWLRSYEAVQGLAGLVRDLSIACELRPRKALYLAGGLLGAEALAKEGRLRQSIGLPSRLVDRGSLLAECGMVRDGALMSTGAADVNPVHLTHGLLRVAMSRGGGAACTRGSRASRTIDALRRGSDQRGCRDRGQGAGLRYRLRTGERCARTRTPPHVDLGVRHPPPTWSAASRG